MDFIQIVITAISSILILFILTKVTGNREMSQLSMFDYINGITIGSIAAELSTELEKPLNCVIAMLTYGIVTLGISVACEKSIKIRKFITGEPLILLIDNKMYYKNFKKSRLGINEFMMQARINGYFNISEIHIAVIETNGTITFLPKAASTPVTQENLNIQTEEKNIIYNVIMDGKVVDKNLIMSNKDRKWLEKQLKSQKHKLEEIFLGTLDNNGNLSLYLMEK